MAVLAESERRPTEGVLLEQPNVTLYVGARNVAAGTLFICENILSWIKDDDLYLDIPYRGIILHAISRDLTNFSEECIYMHTEFEIPDHLKDPAQSEESSSDDEMDDESPKVTEIRLVPANKEALPQIFNVIAQCQTMHSDPAGSESEDDESMGDDADYEVNLPVQGIANMNIQMNGANGLDIDVELDEELDEEQFEDAP